MTNRTGGEKRKRCAYDDGIRGSADHQSYIFAEPIISKTQYRLEPISTSINSLQQAVSPSAERESRDAWQSTSTPYRHPSAIPKRDIPVSLGLSTARQEYRSILLCNQGRQRESSTFSSRSSIVGKESLSKPKRKLTTGSGSSSTQYSPAPLDTAATIRSSSSSSLLPAHLRPSAVNDQDLLSAERYASSLRLLATWESIALKYADIDPEEDAEIDIATGRIVRGKEKVAQMPDRVIGGMSESDEEAKELRTSGNPAHVKVESDNCRQTITILPSNSDIAAQSSLPDEEESDESDLDELDTWDKDEMEIQIEALPLSHTTKPRSHRPWTADDDVDLQEFMRAEERRRARFGDIDEEDEGEQEEEEVSVSARVMDKEEAMSRRTVHASSPYFPPDCQAPLSKTKQYAVSPPLFFSESQRAHEGRSERASLKKCNQDTGFKAQAVEDEFEQLFATPSQLPDLDRCNPIFHETCSSSASTYISHTVEPASTYLRQSSPSSASSYLVFQHTSEANSSSERSSDRGYEHSRSPYTSPRLHEEDICESALLNSSPAERDDLEDVEDARDFADAKYAEPVKQVLYLEEKQNLNNDEGRYTPDYTIELVVEVPIRDYRAFEYTTDTFPTVSPAYEEPLDGDQSRLRRSSRRAAQGKSYALRKKRNGRPVERTQSMDEDPTSLSDDGDFLETDPSAKHASPFPAHGQVVLKNAQVDATAVGTSTLSDTDRSRSPSVVEGTPEPATPQSPPSLDLSSIFEYLLEHDRQATTSSPESGKIRIGDAAEDKDVIDHTTTPAVVEDGLDSFPAPPPPLCMSPVASVQPSALQSESPASDAEERFDHSYNLNMDDLAENGASQRIGLPTSLPADVPEATASTAESDATNIEDDEDILLLGATFEDETEVIWPEVKPDLSMADTVPPILSEDPTIGCEMSFRSVKGEKQELSTFTAPFRCSRIIDLTGDDICDDDEHDELDEW
ncbi:hypothetical protein QFC21_001501 [Naganishia friedmannii]|uniref:Uncharacterized protein n=1 Tax=Naganishia friedmannii TaxID=89922 RepID=A0ACC2W4W6_9TREE|nr:hypothetical protein QFC21_001501 [Naganishia friedmannii]